MKFALAPMELAAMSSPAPPSVGSCCAEGTKCAWRFHPTWLASSSRPGLRRSPTGRIRRSSWTTDFVRNFWKIQNPISLVRAGTELLTQGWAEMSRTLTSLADGADLLLTGQTYQAVAANVAEYYDIPLAALHHFPMRVNGQLVSDPAAAVGPLRNFGDLVAALAHDQGRRRRATP